MKTRNVDLKNTPLLTNNICKYIYLEAPSFPELKKKVKEYEILLVRALTNAYKLSNLSLDKNGDYTILPDGNYQSSIFLNFSGIKKDEITNPEKTLQYIKHLTGMESKRLDANVQRVMPKQGIKEFHKSIILPVELMPDKTENEAISDKQRQLLEQLIEEGNLIKISFLKENKNENMNANRKTIYLKVEYDYRESIRIPITHSNPNETESR